MTKHLIEVTPGILKLIFDIQTYQLENKTTIMPYKLMDEESILGIALRSLLKIMKDDKKSG